MYSKEQASALRKEFWTSFGLFMKPVLSAEYQRINWVSYKTGVKGIDLKLVAGQNEAYLTIEIKTKDLDIKNLLFEQFLEFKNLFSNEVGADWEWIEQEWERKAE